MPTRQSGGQRQAVPLTKSYLLLNHGPVVMITSAAGGRCNVMSAAWVGPLDFDPPKVMVVVDKRAYTRELIEASGEFVLNIPCRAIASKVIAAGSSSGRDGDKLAGLDLRTADASRVSAPLLDECVAWLECKVIPEPANAQKYDLLIAEVVAASANPAVFSDGRWHFPDAASRTIHYQAGGSFFMTGEAFDAGA